MFSHVLLLFFVLGSIAVLETVFRNNNNVVFAPDSEKGEVLFLQRGHVKSTMLPLRGTVLWVSLHACISM